MEKAARLEAYFQEEGPFREGLARLRELLLEAGLEEHLKWGAPVYTHQGVNLLGLMAFKKHFSLWFFQGVFLTDPLGVLTNAQEGKTKEMRHWKFIATDQINAGQVRAYIQEAMIFARKGLKRAPAPLGTLKIPDPLQAALGAEPGLLARFNALTPSKRRDYVEFISSAKQLRTIERRLQKILPMIREGIGLNDHYRKS